MATYFARGILNDDHLQSMRLSSSCKNEALRLPPHKKIRFLASRALLSELLFMLYGISELPGIITRSDGKSVFSDNLHLCFSTACAGNIVGVALSTEDECGLSMALQHSLHGFHRANSPEINPFSNCENLWIKNQSDPDEARTQLLTLRQSVLRMTGDSTNNTRQLQILPGSGRLRTTQVMQIEAICDAEDVLVWSIAVSPSVGPLKMWQFDSHTGWRGLSDIRHRTRSMMRFTSLRAEKMQPANPITMMKNKE